MIDLDKDKKVKVHLSLLRKDIEKNFTVRICTTLVEAMAHLTGVKFHLQLSKLCNSADGWKFCHFYEILKQALPTHPIPKNFDLLRHFRIKLQ